MSKSNRATIIEGIGDDAIYGICILMAGIIPVFGTLYYWQRRRYAPQTIHSDSQPAVQGVRERLRNQNRPAAVIAGQRNARPQGQDEITCPICIAEARYAIETNCGHIFCGECITTYWRHGNWLGAVRCPVCRQTVNILLLNFSEEENIADEEDKTEIVQQINRYNRRFSGEPISWIDYIRDLPTLLRHCIHEFFSVGGLIWMYRLRIIVMFFLALLYFISPLDIIPEAVFGVLGLIDDLFILLLLAIYVSIIYRRVITERATQAAGNS